MKIKPLNWDTIFFGYLIGSIVVEKLSKEKLEELLRIQKESAFKLIYIYPKDKISNITLKSFKIPLVDIKVTFEKKIFSQKILSNIFSYEANDPYDILVNLALSSGEFSRFKTDRNFLNNEFHRLYSEWIKKSVSKEIATDVIIYRHTNKIFGFASYKITSKGDIIIGLIAVDKIQQNKGVGKMLMQAIENIAFKNKSNKIIVYTQFENQQAMAFYHSCGYKVKKQQEIYHLWIR
jgi:dTDP-4-amino-4,6-dideoxy-D-galactose acyltransferase